MRRGEKGDSTHRTHSSAGNPAAPIARLAHGLGGSLLAAPLLAFLAGGLNVFAFAPFGWWPLQLITLAFVFWLVLLQSSWKRSALIGWAYGSGWILSCVHWLYVSMHVYGNLPAWMAALAVLLFSFGLGAFASAGLGGASWLRQRLALKAGMTALLVLPACWLLAEWLRGWVLTGFPWVSSGYAHSTGPLAGYAPVAGVYGLALIAAVISGCLTLLPYRRLPIILALCLMAGGFALKGMEWTTPNGRPISVRLLQGNVPQEMKFAPERIAETLALYQRMIVAQPADLIVTPETAIPLLSSQLPPDYLDGLVAYSIRSKSHLALGIPVSDGPGRYANSLVGVSPGANTFYRYDKHHLVPFGEFIPPGARWFVEMMRIPLGDFARGEVLQQPFGVRDQWVLPNICYEDLFGEEIAAQLSASGMPQATILLNISNIAWFGDSIALPQHLQISQMRALETGRPMLRATNTGATAVIAPTGKVVARLDPYSQATLSAVVQGYRGLTPYSRYGNTPVVVAALLLLGTACGAARRRPQQSA